MNSISKQILASLLATVLVVLGGVGYLELHNTLRLAQEDLRHDQRIIVERLSYSLVYPLWNLNRAEVEKAIQSEAAEENVRAILLYDESGELYAGMIREDVDGGLKTYSPNNSLHRQLLSQNQESSTREIIKNGKPIGKVVLYPNTDRLQSIMQQQKIRLFLKLLGFFAALSFVQFFVLRKVIIQPLTKLKEWVSSIGPDKMLPAPKLTHSVEVDALTSSFSAMTNRLTSTLTEIVDKNAELQKREAELQDRNEKLMATKEMLKKQIDEFERSQILLADEINERKHAQSEVAKLNSQLELRVVDRTAQLEVAIKDLSIARDVSEAATRAKSQFLANMSHEIRTPMNAILGYTQLMQRMPELTDKLKNYTSIIARSGDHLLALINNILEMSKIEAGGITLLEEDVNVQALIKDLESMLKMRAQEKELTLDFAIDTRLPEQIYADATKLRQILVNIIGNAIKFTDHGGIHVRVTLQGSEMQTLRVCIEIADTGLGIAEHEQSKVFEAFEQTESGHRKGGTGLGMAISRQYARMMGGDLTFDSVVGKGTTVRLTIVAQGSQGLAGETSNNVAERIVSLVPDSVQPKILIVDDIESNRDILRLMLEDVGFCNILEVADGKEVQAVIESSQPDIVLMDRRMPGMDGLQAIRVIRKLPQGQNTRIIMVTASAFEEDRQLAIASGTDGFVGKPFRTEEILNEIQRLFPTVVYRYEDSDSMLHKTTALTDYADAVASLDASLVTELMYLIECGNVMRFEQVVERLRGSAPLLCDHLQQLADKFDYASILAVLKPGIK